MRLSPLGQFVCCTTNTKCTATFFQPSASNLWRSTWVSRRPQHFPHWIWCQPEPVTFQRCAGPSVVQRKSTHWRMWFAYACFGQANPPCLNTPPRKFSSMGATWWNKFKNYGSTRARIRELFFLRIHVSEDAIPSSYAYWARFAVALARTSSDRYLRTHP